VKKVTISEILFFHLKLFEKSFENDSKWNILGEQFTQFTKLSEFLLRQNGLQLEIDEFDDPGQIISQIMEHCRRLSGSVNVDFPPQKLRPGYGTFVTELLHDLAEAALKVRLPRTVCRSSTGQSKIEFI